MAKESAMQKNGVSGHEVVILEQSVKAINRLNESRYFEGIGEAQNYAGFVASAFKLMIMEPILFATTFTGVTSAIYHIGFYYYRKKIKENQDLISISKLDADLWTKFSKYIRSREADWKGYVTCFTCPTTDDWRTFDAGHYIPKATSGSYLKFYEKNVHPQCINCNRLKGGNYTEYKNRLIVKYGLGIIEELNALRQSPPLTVSDYRQKISYYGKQLKLISLK